MLQQKPLLLGCLQFSSTWVPRPGSIHVTKMATVRKFVFVVAIYSINLRVRKRSFVTSDYIGLTLTEMEAEKVKYSETFIWASQRWRVSVSYAIF